MIDLALSVGMFLLAANGVADPSVKGGWRAAGWLLVVFSVFNMVVDTWQLLEAI